MRRTRLLTSFGTALFVAVILCCPHAGAACSYPITSKFGIADNFTPPSDPIPYAPTALPEFVTFLNNNGVSTASMTNFDDHNPNRWAIATLRHGLAECFPGASTLTLCFDALALANLPNNDNMAIYDTDAPIFSFPAIYSNSMAALAGGSWNAGMTATICIDLTQQMISGQVGFMLQLAVQDDTVVDSITLTLQ